MDVAIIDVTVLPSVCLEDRRFLPDISAIYFALSESSEVLYVGKARRLVVRWNGTNHHRYIELAEIGNVRIAWIAIDEPHLNYTEATYINQLNPKLNNARRHTPRLHEVGFSPPPPRLESNLLVLAAKKAQREGRYISLQTVAREAKIQRQTIHNFVENTLREYPKDALESLCRYFDCQLGELLVLSEDVEGE